MGYTHYFTLNKNTNKRTLKTAIKVCGDAFIDANYLSNDDDELLFNDNLMSFNGIDDEAHETFVVDLSEAGEFQFCKTAMKQYDVAVVACLTILKHYLGSDIKISSDGDKKDLRLGFGLAQVIIDEKQETDKKAAIKLSLDLWAIKNNEEYVETPKTKAELIGILKRLTLEELNDIVNDRFEAA